MLSGRCVHSVHSLQRWCYYRGTPLHCGVVRMAQSFIDNYGADDCDNNPFRGRNAPYTMPSKKRGCTPSASRTLFHDPVQFTFVGMLSSSSTLYLRMIEHPPQGRSWRLRPVPTGLSGVVAHARGPCLPQVQSFTNRSQGLTGPMEPKKNSRTRSAR